MAKVVVTGAGIGGISEVCELRQGLGREHPTVPIACEQDSLHEVHRAKTGPYHEKAVMKMMGARRLQESA